MKQSKLITNILILVMGAMILTGGIASAVMMHTVNERREAFKVELADGKSEYLAVRDLEMVPGKTSEHTYFLSTEFDLAYDLSIGFLSVEKEIGLADYIYVTLVLDDKEIAKDLLLADLIDGDKINSVCKSSKYNHLTVKYTMPAPVANDAESTKAFFDLELTAKRDNT